MDPRFLELYAQELLHIQDMGAEFAQRFPKIASRLGLASTEVADPYVERLLEGFAFLAARVQLKIRESHPEFTGQLLELVYPGLRASRPSMGIVKFEPDCREGRLNLGVPLPRGTALWEGGGAEHPACQYRTAHALTLWPLRIAELRCSPTPPKARQKTGKPSAQAFLQVTLQAQGEGELCGLPCDALDFYIAAPMSLASTLWHAIKHQLESVWAWSGEDADASSTGLQLELPGLAEEESLLPSGPSHFSATRLLQEFYSLPQRFLFFRVSGLAAAFQRAQGQALSLCLALKHWEPNWGTDLNRDSLSLFCTPVINLFEHHCDRVELDPLHQAHALIPDRIHSQDYEVHSVLEVEALNPQTGKQMRIPPLYKPDLNSPRESLGYVARRSPRVVSQAEQKAGGRSRYIGTQTHLCLSWPDARLRDELKVNQLRVKTLCSNRDLPLLIHGKGRCLTVRDSLPVRGIVFLAGPSSPYALEGDGRASWQLIQHLSLNFLGLVQTQGPPALRQLLALYANPEDAAQIQWAQSIESLSAEPCVRTVFRMGRACALRGLLVKVDVHSPSLQGVGEALFAEVLSQILARHVSVNSFVECHIRCLPSGRSLRGVPLAGSRPLI